MIYLRKELEYFVQAKQVFAAHFQKILTGMFDTFEAKGRTRDTGSPIWHRQNPLGMLAIIQAKCRRVESILSLPSRWAEEEDLLESLIEECSDAAIFLAFIAALCSMLLDELHEREGRST